MSVRCSDSAELENTKTALAQAQQRLRVLEVGSSKMSELADVLKRRLTEVPCALPGVALG